MCEPDDNPTNSQTNLHGRKHNLLVTITGKHLRNVNCNDLKQVETFTVELKRLNNLRELCHLAAFKALGHTAAREVERATSVSERSERKKHNINASRRHTVAITAAESRTVLNHRNDMIYRPAGRRKNSVILSLVQYFSSDPSCQMKFYPKKSIEEREAHDENSFMVMTRLANEVRG